MKQKYLVLVVFLLFSLLISLIVHATEYETGEDWSATTEYEDETEDEDDEDWIYRGSLGDEGYDEKYDAETAPGFSLFFGMKLYCHVENRDPENGFVVYDGETKEGYLFMDDYLDYIFMVNYIDYGTLKPFLPYNDDFSENALLDAFFEEADGTYQWRYPRKTITVSVPITSENTYDNAKLHRFEGLTEDNTNFENYGCIPFVGLVNIVNFTASLPLAFDAAGNVIDIELYSDEGQPPVLAYDDPSVGFDIDWDKTKEDCDAIGGDWYDEEGFSSSYGSHRCCGDDRMWLKNRAVNSDDGFSMPTISDADYEAVSNGEQSAAAYCLYGSGDIIQEDVWAYLDLGENDQYTCTETYFDPYDDTLKADDDYEGDKAENREVPFFFQGTEGADDETDIGKWSDNSNQNPQLCLYNYSERVGEEYQWLDVNTAGDLPVDIEGNEITNFKEDHAETICEQYLGGTWTGAYCCGNKYDYPDDDYDYGHEGEYFGESFSDETPIYWYEGSTENIYANYACVDGTVVDTQNTAEKEGTDGQIYELLNVEGNLFSCAVDDPFVLGIDYYTRASLVVDDSDYDVAACDVVEGQLCSYNPDAENGYYPWQWEAITSSAYVTNTLLYSEGDLFRQSTAKWASTEGYEQDSACCAGNTCWDGDECVSETTIYTYGADEDGDSIGDEVAICSAGAWQYPTEPKYDWYHNTDAEAVTYCAYPYACVCSSNEDDNTFCTENDAYIKAGCTLVEDFYKEDHFCEAQNTDGDTNADASRWTSRTKFLAFQLLEIAQIEGMDFTLFCDRYTDAINNYANLEPVEDDINSVCVLEQEGKITLGLTLNSENDDEPMNINTKELLFDSGSKSIVPNILEEDAVDNCDDAISYTSTKRFGEFYSCAKSTTTWYNNNLNALIYSKDGLDYKTLIDYFDTESESWQDTFDDYKYIITTHITDAADAGTLVNPDTTPLSPYFAEFNNVQDYSSLYYNYVAAAGNTIFGFQEIKYSENAGDNRYYTAVLYNGYALDCDQVYAPYDTALPVYCNSDAGIGIVLERSTTGSEYWTDLTAAIRIKS